VPTPIPLHHLADVLLPSDVVDALAGEADGVVDTPTGEADGEVPQRLRWPEPRSVPNLFTET
jgi:hypothetical protein